MTACGFANQASFTLILWPLSLAAVQFFNNGTGVFGRNVGKQMALTNIDGADDFAGKSGLTGNRIHHIDRQNSHRFANIHPYARLLDRRAPALFEFSGPRCNNMGALFAHAHNLSGQPQGEAGQVIHHGVWGDPCSMEAEEGHHSSQARAAARFFTFRFTFARNLPGRGGGIAYLKLMHQRGRDIGGTEAFFKQAFDEMILLLEVSALQRGAQFVEKHHGARFFHLTRRRRFAALYPDLRETLDVVDLKHFAAGDE